MSTTFEKLEDNKVKLTFSVDAETLEKGLDYAYKKRKNQINIQGFRKGKVPRKLVEAQFGVEFLFEDAIDFIFPEAYGKALDEHEVEPVARPSIDVTEISKENGATFTVEVVIKPEITVSDYKGLSYEKFDKTVTDEDIDVEIQKAREQNARVASVSGRKTKDGDIVVIDYEGFVDDVAFDGGKGEDHELTLGSQSFIDTFEEQLVDHEVGDDVEVNVTFPEEYHAPDLAGKKALFKVEIKDVKEQILPEVDDEFAQDVSEFDTLDEYKNDLRETLEKAKEEESANDKHEKVMNKLIEKVVDDIPKEMFDNQANQMLNSFKNRVKQSGMDFNMYTQFLGQTEEQIKETYAEPAEKQVKARLALECIVRAENIEVSDDEFNAELEKMAGNYKMTLEQLQNAMPEDDKKEMKFDMKVQKAVDLVIESAVEA